jgi:hypothetical protein
MIEQDSRWRADLLRMANTLEGRYREKRWSDGTRWKIEKDVFVSAYIVRKLLDANRVNRSILETHWTVAKYPIIPSRNPRNDPKTFASTYSLMKGKIEKINLKELSNQFIHSYIFSPFVVGRSMLGIFFASDLDSRSFLCYIPLVEVIRMIRSVGENRPIKTKLHRHDSKFFVQ